MRLDFYKIECGFYLIPTIEVVWFSKNRFALSFIWMNRDITIWLRDEKTKVDKSYPKRTLDPFGNHFEDNRFAAPSINELNAQDSNQRCGTCLEILSFDVAAKSNGKCNNPRCSTNLGYEFPRR